SCPVDCIHWIDYTNLKNLEEEREYQVIPRAGLPIEPSIIASKMKERKLGKKRRKKR
ncbi:MAG: ferredoxin, partial [Moorea sp. SIO2I5]|nr:ferredoxin [Moorena sp. SIO2I5]